MSHLTKKKDHNEEIVKSIHKFSNEAFTLAKLFIAGSDVPPLKQKASDLESQLPAFAARMKEADQDYRAGLNRTLSDARLDLAYVHSEGKRPSSIRLWHVIRESQLGNEGEEESEGMQIDDDEEVID